jgi:crotonobetainyl-CoA:carnitine CoA-transferase CaiB-like acyl-CoA transferase
MAPVMKQRTSAQWIGLLEPLSIPCGPINRIDQVFADPQVVHRGLRVDVPHPVSGTLPLVANPIKFSRTPLTFDAPPPLLGQHTEAVLRTLLGKTDEDIRALRQRGIL